MTSSTAGPATYAAEASTISLYLHIPFCSVKCHYCDFNTYAGVLRWREPYVAALREEILAAGRRVRLPDGTPRSCRTIYLGGGTPSLLAPEQLEALLAAAREAFAVAPGAEISMEANPGTLEYGPLAEFRAAGVTRLSMGAQSFDAGLLRWLGRIHSPEDVERALASAREARFDSVNLDLMYALPGQTMAQWSDTLDRALATGADHFSAYSLIVEEHTPLWRWVEQGKVVPVEEDLAADMYELARERFAAAGYVHYELSNWARPGHQCAHNLTYWHNLPYLGLGAGAHSWYGGARLIEARHLRDYIARVEAADGNAPALAVVEIEPITRPLERAETMMMGLRLLDGVSLARYHERFGTALHADFATPVRELSEIGLLEHQGDTLRLSSRGLLLGNEVFERFLP